MHPTLNVKIVPNGNKNMLVNGAQPIAELKSGFFGNKVTLSSRLDELAAFVSKTLHTYKINPANKVAEVWTSDNGEFSVRFGINGLAYEVYSLSMDNDSRAAFGLSPISEESRRNGGRYSI